MHFHNDGMSCADTSLGLTSRGYTARMPNGSPLVHANASLCRESARRWPEDGPFLIGAVACDSAVGRTIPSKRIIPIMQAAQIEKASTRPDREYADSVRFPSQPGHSQNAIILGMPSGHFRHSGPLTGVENNIGSDRSAVSPTEIAAMRWY